MTWPRQMCDGLGATVAKLRRFWGPRVVPRLLHVKFWFRHVVVRRSIVDPASPVIVSMTTFGPRLRRVYLAIESIAAGQMLPGRILLYVDAEDFDKAMSMPSIRRLMARGLELGKGERALRAHKKYFHAVMDDVIGDRFLTIADDDFFYSEDWLARLWREFCATNHDMVVADLVRIMRFKDEKFDAYVDWPHPTDTRARPTNFFLGGSGTIFPGAVVAALREGGRGFVGRTDFADDIWLNWTCFRAGVLARQSAAGGPHSKQIPGSQTVALWQVNGLQAHNDTQLAAIYSTDDIKHLKQLA